MQRILNMNAWRMLGDGEALAFTGENPRQVRLEVNAPDVARLYVGIGNESMFLARVSGRDVIEFSVDTKFDLIVMGGECAVYTADGQEWAVKSVDNQTFTRIVERRQRNPELELMMLQATRNMEKRAALQMEEMERRLKARINAPYDNAGTVAIASGTTSASATTPVVGGASDESPAPTAVASGAGTVPADG